MAIKKEVWIIALILILTVSLAYASIFVDDTQAEFNNGTYANSVWNTDHIELGFGQISGTYTSAVFDAEVTATWNNIAWQGDITTTKYLFVVDGDADIWKSSDSGSNWSLQKDDYTGADANNADYLVVNSTGSLFILFNQDLWVSNDKGISWTKVNDDYNGGDGNNGFVIDIDSNDYIYIVDGSEDVWKSTDNGASFTKVNDDLDGGTFIGDTKAITVNSSDAIFVVLANADIWTSTDSGTNWNKVNDDYNGGETNNAGDMASNSSNALFILRAQDLWQSTNNGVNWTKINDDFNVGDSNDGQRMHIDENDYIYIADGGEDMYGSSDPSTAFTLLASNINGGNGNIKGITSANVSTNLTFQVRSDDDNASWGNFIGPDGTSNTYYTNSTETSLNVSNNRYFQYKFYFTSEDNETTPELYNITIDYTTPDTTSPTWDFTPADQTIEYGSAFSYDVNATDAAGISNYFINDTTRFAVNSTGAITNATILAVADYDLNISVNDTTNNINSTTITVTVQNTSAPIITSTTPTNQSNLAAGTTSTAIKLTTNEIAGCRYNTTNTTWANMTQLNITNSTEHNFTVTGLSNGNSYTYYFICEDDENLSNRMSSSYVLQFSISNPDDGGGSSGGGGSSRKYECNDYKDNDGDGLKDWPNDPGCSGRLDDDETDVIEEELIVIECIESWSCSAWYECVNRVQARTCVDANACETAIDKPGERRECDDREIVDVIKNEYDEYRFKGDKSKRFSFKYKGETHYVTINKVHEDSVDVVIESEPIYLTLRVDKAENVDIDFDGTPDTRIILKNIENGKAEIVVRIIGEGIGSVTGEAIKVLPYKGPNPYYLIPTILLLIVFIVLISIKKSHLSEKKKKLITVLDISLMGLIFILFLSAIIKQLPVGAFLSMGANGGASISDRITISTIIIAFALAIVSGGMIIIEKKKIAALNRTEKRNKLRSIMSSIKRKKAARAAARRERREERIIAKRRPNQDIAHSLKKIYKL